jgi:putative membrane protein
MPTSISQFLRGFAMGTADLIPGVSGGTVALVLGIYRRLVLAIRTGAGALGRLVRLDFGGFVARLKEVDWRFLIPLLVGIAAAVLSLSHLIEHLLETEPVPMAGLFFGLVLGSLVVAWRLIEERDPVRLTVLVAVAAVIFWLLGLSAGTVSDPSLWAFFGAGAVAICAMILPGISGSFLLLMMGMYAPVLGAVNDRQLLAVGVFLVGAVLGLASFSTLLHAMLDRYHDTVMAALVGLMAGSLRVLWPWPDGTGGTSLDAPDGDLLAPVLLAVAGAAIVLIVTRREEAIAEDVEEAGEAAETVS